MPTIRMPDNEIVEKKYAEYVSTLGRVAHSWNFLQEKLGQLFVAVLPTAPTLAVLAIWYSEPNDRAQRRMLRAAINASALKGWRPNGLPDSAEDDILWLLKEADELSGRRDEAIHTPAVLQTDHTGTEMAAAFYSGNPMAKRLEGKKLLEEFALSTWRAEQLSYYAQKIAYALTRQPSSWPDKRPSLSRELHRQLVESNPQQEKK
jgi:hypothetical protein